LAGLRTFRNIGPLNTNGAEAQPPHLLASLRKTAPGPRTVQSRCKAVVYPH